MIAAIVYLVLLLAPASVVSVMLFGGTGDIFISIMSACVSIAALLTVLVALQPVLRRSSHSRWAYRGVLIGMLACVPASVLDDELTTLLSKLNPVYDPHNGPKYMGIIFSTTVMLASDPTMFFGNEDKVRINRVERRATKKAKILPESWLEVSEMKQWVTRHKSTSLQLRWCY